MSYTVKGPGPKPVEVPDADDVEPDEFGNLILTSGEGRSEQTVAVFAAGAWFSAEKR